MEIPVTRERPERGLESAPAEEVLRRGVAERVFPGAVAACGSTRGARWISGVGRLDYTGGPATGARTIYDLASLTKVVATTSVVMRLVDGGRISLEARVRDLIPEFQGGERELVTIEHLLTHSSGLPAWRPLYKEARGRVEVLARILEVPLDGHPAAAERYSDLGAILLGECAARAGGKPLAALAWELVFDPLAMRETCFCPPESARGRIAPTEEDREYRGGLVHGVVHDENAHAMGGVSGHAGLFATAEDLARFAVEMLRAVRGAGPSVFTSGGARLFTARRGLVAGSSRALGWDTRSDAEDGTGPPGSRSSSGRRFSPGSFGHTGFTGTSLWVDPARDLFAVLLSNRVHPSRAGEGILQVRRDFHDAVVTGWEDAGAGSRLERALRDLADAWFIVEQEGKPAGYHRMVVREQGEGEIAASDEMVLLARSGPVCLRSEVVTGRDLLSPRRARCETRLGPGKGYAAMRGTVEFAVGSLKLGSEVLIDGLGVRLDSPRVHEGTLKRPAGPILFQSLVPLLLAALPETEDGSGLGEVALTELPAEVDRLIALKPRRRLAISRTEDGARRVVLSAPGGGEGQPVAAAVRFGADGSLARIELERFAERRATRDEVRRALPAAFEGK